VIGEPTSALLEDEDDGTATRAAYLRAATRLVNEYGYRGASVDRIAAELRLTKGSFYHGGLQAAPPPARWRTRCQPEPP
jgi:hypothetical protein